MFRNNVMASHVAMQINYNISCSLILLQRSEIFVGLYTTRLLSIIKSDRIFANEFIYSTILTVPIHSRNISKR